MATRVWSIQLLNCGLVTVLLLLVPLGLYYKFGSFYQLTGFRRWWLLNSLLILSYMVERTRYDWAELRYMRRLGRELTASEFQTRQAHERLHRKALIAALVFGFFVIMLRQSKPPMPQVVLLAFMLILGIKAALNAWAIFRNVNRRSIR